jgi:hypothetical protein
MNIYLVTNARIDKDPHSMHMPHCVVLSESIVGAESEAMGAMLGGGWVSGDTLGIEEIKADKAGVLMYGFAVKESKACEN